MNKLDKIIKDFNFILTETVKIIDKEVSKKKKLLKI